MEKAIMLRDIVTNQCVEVLKLRHFYNLVSDTSIYWYFRKHSLKKEAITYAAERIGISTPNGNVLIQRKTGKYPR